MSIHPYILGSMLIRELIEKLSELPQDWRVVATRAGGSLEVWDEDGVEYGYVFTDGRAPRMLVDRRKAGRDRVPARPESE